MNKKQTYTSPEVEVFVVQIEDCILTVPSVVMTMSLLSGSGDNGFGDSAADVQDLSGQSWW